MADTNATTPDDDPSTKPDQDSHKDPDQNPPSSSPAATGRWAACLPPLTPVEMIAIREKRGLSRSEFAGVTKLGVASVTLWEAGKRRPNVAYDYYLRLLAFDENFERVFTAFGHKSAARMPLPIAPQAASALSSGASGPKDASVLVTEAAQAARQAIKQRIAAMTPEKLETLMAAILRCMNLHPWPADPAARQHGIALVGYSDPMGTSAGPRVVVSILAPELASEAAAQLGKMTSQLREGDVALVVSPKGFAEDAIAAVRDCHRRVEFVDVDRLVELWIQHYDHATTADRSSLPLRTTTIVALE